MMMLDPGPQKHETIVFRTAIGLRVQVPNNRVLTQNLYYNYHSPKPKYPIIEYLDPLGSIT